MSIDTTVSAQLKLQAIQRNTAIIEVVGTSPLIVHRWCEKQKQMMLDKQQGRKAPKQVKDPQAEYESSMYRFPDGGHGFPTLGFKAASVSAAGRVFGKNVKMTELRVALSFLADGIAVGSGGEQITRITGEPIMREDMVRLGIGGADLRYRAQYVDWSARLLIQYLPNMLDLETVASIIDIGGVQGIGEWRPEKDGIYGTYQVSSIDQIQKENA